MNYAVHSATAVTFPCRHASPNATFKSIVNPSLPNKKRRITINVGGEQFQTYENTLARYPESLLGSPERRQQFYDARKNELKFPGRDKNVFNAILFFYQADILSRPDDITLEIFLDEIKFFDIAMYCHEIPQRNAFKTETAPPDDIPRNRVWNFLENPRTKCSKWFARLNLLLVFTWLFILCLETRYASGHVRFMGWKHVSWFVLDTLFVIWFTVDYVIHISCEPRLTSYILSPMGLIDLITILPYYVTLMAHSLGGATISPQMGVVRFLRVFRLFKATRYSSAFRILLGSLTSSARDFPIWFVLVFMHIVFFSSILYYLESDVNNPQFSNIPDVMYFTIITMCAVGYGDAVPQSALGKMVTSLAALTGIVIVYCIPAPTLKTNFNRLNDLHASEQKDEELRACNDRRRASSNYFSLNNVNIIKSPRLGLR